MFIYSESYGNINCMQDTKICKICKINKKLDLFYKYEYKYKGQNTLKYRSLCIECFNEKYYHLQKERRDNYQKEYKEKNKEAVSVKRKESYQKNKEEELEQNREYVKKNLQKVRTYQYEYRKERRKNDPLYKLQRNLRGRIWSVLSKNKTGSGLLLLGAPVEEVRGHLESLFQPNMTWDNYGFYGWHIDHIIPLSSAKTKEELEKLCHYTNLQPLWAIDNLKKSKTKAKICSWIFSNSIFNCFY